jgi:sialate O-acetylesterase
LQREKPVPVWGWAKPGVEVEVTFGGQKKQAKADERGYWKAVPSLTWP